MESVHAFLAGGCPKASPSYFGPQPSSPYGRQSTLMVSMLDFCVRNFEEVFFVRSQPAQKRLPFHGITMRPEVRIESNLFERIVDRSRNGGCLVRPDLLRLCLAYRDALNWQDIDLYYTGDCREGLLSDEDIRNVASSEIPVKRLSFCTARMTESMMYYLSMFSEDLERLEIGPLGRVLNDNSRRRYRINPNSLSRFHKEKVKLPRLKFLSLSFESFPDSLFHLFDMKTCSTALNVLKLTSFGAASPHFINDVEPLVVEVLRNAKNLVTLSLAGSCFGDGFELSEVIGSLKELRTLDMRGMDLEDWFNERNVDLSKLISSLPSLINLEISCSDLQLSDPDVVNRKNLRYVGLYEVTDYDLSRLKARSIGSEKSLEGLVTCLEAFDDPAILVSILMRISSFLSSTTPNEFLYASVWSRLERGILKCLNEHPYDLSIGVKAEEMVNRGYCYGHWSPGVLSQEFKTFFLHLQACHQAV